MAEYYEIAIVPARVHAPQDKSLAEGTVKFATTWIIAAYNGSVVKTKI